MTSYPLFKKKKSSAYSLLFVSELLLNFRALHSATLYSSFYVPILSRLVLLDPPEEERNTFVFRTLFSVSYLSSGIPLSHGPGCVSLTTSPLSPGVPSAPGGPFDKNTLWFFNEMRLHSSWSGPTTPWTYLLSLWAVNANRPLKTQEWRHKGENSWRIISPWSTVNNPDSSARILSHSVLSFEHVADYILSN